MLSRARRAIKPAHLFVLPHTIFLVLFGIGPALYALVISFASFRAGTPEFFAAGLDNYARRLQRLPVPACLLERRPVPGHLGTARSHRRRS